VISFQETEACWSMIAELFGTYLFNAYSCPRNFAMLRLLIIAPRPDAPMISLMPLDVHLLEISNGTDLDGDNEGGARVYTQCMLKTSAQMTELTYD
jgi:hypothetical protein